MKDMSEEKKKVFVGYLRTDESYDKRLTALFIYHRPCKKQGIVKRIRVTVEEL